MEGLLLAFLLFPAMVQGSCDDITYLSNNLDIRYNILDNIQDSWLTFLSELRFRNSGDKDIPAGEGTWAIYNYNIRLYEPDLLKPKPDIVPDPEGAPLGDSGLKVIHVQATLFKIVPTAEFKGIKVGETLSFQFKASDWEVSFSDAMPNWYVADSDCPDVDAATIKSTAGESMSWVGPFDNEKKWKRIGEDLYNPYSPEERFERFEMEDEGEAMVHILPTPRKTELLSEDRISLEGWVITQDGAMKEALYLADRLQTQVVGDSDAPSRRYVRVEVDPSAVGLAECDGNPGYYMLEVSRADETVRVVARTAQGAFYGVQSLLALAADAGGVPHGSVQDCPRYPWRGMHVDVARNFHPKASILKILEVMAMYKLNKFHFHLCDDEGWRQEIPGLEELTTVGSRRCHDESGERCLLPQLGSGATVGSAGSGFYTVQDYQEILQYAHDRHIEVIPEFDMPGHSHAAINAMLARYKKYKDTNLAMAEEYLLTDLDDPSEYFSVQMYTDNAINPCMDSTYKFVEKVMNEMILMHQNIQPLETFHFGGDEVPDTAWLESPECDMLQETHPELNYTKALKGYFVLQTGEIAKRLGLKLAGWEDGFTDEGDIPFDSSLFGEEVYSHVWNNIWEWGAAKHAYMQANAGYKVIMSHVTHLYFDHPSEPDPQERGFYWGPRFCDTFKTFSYLPDHIYWNMDEDKTRMGDELDREAICAESDSCPALEKPENVVGIQGQLWSETVRTATQLNEMIFPRLLAVAERAWNKASWEDIADTANRQEERLDDWKKFAHSLGYRELRRLEEIGVEYNLRPPGFKPAGEDLKLEGISEFPGQRIQLSSDGGETWMDYRPGQTATSGATYTVRTSSHDGRRASRTYDITFPDTSSATPVTLSMFLLSLLTAATIIINHV